MIYCKRKLGATDVKYGIICAGSKFDIGCNKPVKVKVNGRIYHGKMHSSTKGRIDGLSQMFIDCSLKQGEELELCYDESSNIIEITQMIEGSNEFDSFIQSENVTDSVPVVQEFDGEYYNFSGYKKFSHKMAIYGNKYYFLHQGDVITCKFGEKKGEPLIKNALKKTGDSHQQIFVNEVGIFVYDSLCDRGVICRLFDYDGKVKDTFEIKRTGRKSEGNCIHCFSYIVGDAFYCVSDKEYMVYRFNTGERHSSELEIPDSSELKGLIVSDSQVYLRIARRDKETYREVEQWYRLVTDSTLSYTSGQMRPIFKNVNQNMVFLHPKKNIVWIESYDKPCDNSLEALRRELRGEEMETRLRTYTAYSLVDGKMIRKVKVSDKYSSDKIIYFDGRVMYALLEERCMHKIDLTTGKGEQLDGVFEADKFLVFNDDLYVTKDYLAFDQWIVSIPTEYSSNGERKICNRIW